MKRINYTTLIRIICFILISISIPSLLNSCNKDDEFYIGQNTESDLGTTRAEAPGYHWTCPKCKFWNMGFRNYCSICNTAYDPHLSDLTTCMFRIVEHFVEFKRDIGGGGIDYTPDDPNLLQLPNLKYPAYPPKPWYESTAAMKYYNQMRKESAYMLTPGYAEAAEYAWFRTTRILYPGVHKKSEVEKEYNRFMRENSKNFTGFKGDGIKAGSKAAIDGFLAYQ